MAYFPSGHFDCHNDHKAAIRVGKIRWKYRLGREDEMEIGPFLNLLKTFMIQVVIKAEKYQDQEIPKKQIIQIIESLEQEKVKVAILDVLQVTLDPGLGKIMVDA